MSANVDRSFLSQTYIREAARQQRQRSYELNLTLYRLDKNGEVEPVSARALYNADGTERR